MPRAGWCDVENTWVWVNDDGSCVNGHGPEHVSRVYDTDTQSAPPPVQPAPDYPPVPPAAPGQYGYGAYGSQEPVRRDNKPVIALILGIGSILCCFPIVTLPMGIAGLVMGIQSLKSDRRGMAIAAIVLSSLGIVASIVNAVFGAILSLDDPRFQELYQQLG